MKNNAPLSVWIHFIKSLIDLLFIKFSLTPDQDPKEYNFDHPDALDFELAYKCIKELVSWKPTKIPIYNFKTNSREGSIIIQPAGSTILSFIL